MRVVFGSVVSGFFRGSKRLEVVNRLNRKIEYAFIALKYMRGKYAGQITTVKEICEATGIPFDATSKVMQQMAQAKILKSEQGPAGGYLLTSDLSKVTLHEIIELTTGSVDVVRCLKSKRDCEFLRNCNVVSPMKTLSHKLNEFYQTLSVAEILGS